MEQEYNTQVPPSMPTDRGVTEVEFQEFVAELLKVSPEGLSGKHHRVDKQQPVKTKKTRKAPPTR